MCRGIGQRIDDLHLLDDRAGPSVRDDERQRVVVLRTHVNEMNVQPIDLGDELRHGVQPRFARAPVIRRRPIARERLNRRELDALRCIGDRFPFGPPGRVDAPPQFGEFRFRNVHVKRANRGLVSCLCAALLGNTGGGHVFSLSAKRLQRLTVFRHLAPRATTNRANLQLVCLRQRLMRINWPSVHNPGIRVA